MEDQEKKTFTARFEDGRFKKISKRRSSSILKTGPKLPLSDIDVNQQTEHGLSKKTTRKSLSRRVSFADTCEIKVFHKPDESIDNHDQHEEERSNKENEPQENSRGDLTASGLDQLMTAEIQDPGLVCNELCLQENITEVPLPDSLPDVPYDPINKTIYDTSAMEMTHCAEYLGGPIEDDFGEGGLSEKKNATSFLQNLFTKSTSSAVIGMDNFCDPRRTIGESETDLTTHAIDREVSLYTSQKGVDMQVGMNGTLQSSQITNRGLSVRPTALMCLATNNTEDVRETDLNEEACIQSPALADSKSFLSRLKMGSSDGSASFPLRFDNQKMIDRTVVFGPEGENDMEHTEPLGNLSIEVNDTSNSAPKELVCTKIFDVNNDMEETAVMGFTGYRQHQKEQLTQYFDRNDTMEMTTSVTSRIKIGGEGESNSTLGSEREIRKSNLTTEIGKFSLNKTVAYTNDVMEETQALTGGILPLNINGNRSVVSNDDMEETKALAGKILPEKVNVDRTMVLDDNMEETKALTGKIFPDKVNISRTMVLDDNMEETKALTVKITPAELATNKTMLLGDNMEETKALTGKMFPENIKVNRTMVLNENMEETSVLSGALLPHGNDVNKTLNLNDKMEETKALTGRILQEEVINKTMVLHENMEETRPLTVGLSVGDKSSLIREATKQEVVSVESRVAMTTDRRHTTGLSAADEKDEIIPKLYGRLSNIRTNSNAEKMTQDLTVPAINAGISDLNEPTKSLVTKETKNDELPRLVNREITQEDNDVGNNKSNMPLQKAETVDKNRRSTLMSDLDGEPTEVVLSKYQEFLKSGKVKQISLDEEIDFDWEVEDKTDMKNKVDEDLKMENKDVKMTNEDVKETAKKRRSTVRLSSVIKLSEKIDDEERVDSEDYKKEEEKEVPAQMEVAQNDGCSLDNSQVQNSFMGTRASTSDFLNLEDGMEGIMEQLAPEMLTNVAMDTELTNESSGNKLLRNNANFAPSFRHGQMSSGGRDESRTDFDNMSGMSLDTSVLLAHHTGLTTQVMGKTNTINSQETLPSQMAAQNDAINSQQNIPSRTVEQEDDIASQQALTAHMFTQNDPMNIQNDTINRQNDTINRQNDTLNSHTMRSSSSEETGYHDSARSLMSSMSINMVNFPEDLSDEEETSEGPMTMERFCTKFLRMDVPFCFWQITNKRRKSSMASPPQLECEDLRSKLEAEILHGSYVEAYRRIYEEAVATVDSKAKDRERMYERFLDEPPDWVKTALNGVSEEEKFLLRGSVGDLRRACQTMAKKLHYKDIKYRAASSYCTLLKSKLSDLNSKLEHTQQLTATAKDTLDMLSEVEAELDEKLSNQDTAAMATQGQDAIVKKLQEDMKSMEELQKEEDEVIRELNEQAKTQEELEAKLTKLQTQNTKADGEDGAVGEEVLTEEDLDNLRDEVTTLENFSEWIWHRQQSDDHTDIFLFYNETHALIVDKEPSAQNGDIKITDIRVQSLLEDDAGPKRRIAHNLLVQMIDAPSLKEKYRTVEAIPQMLQELSVMVFELKTLLWDLDRAGLTENVLLVRWDGDVNCVNYEKRSMKSLRKVQISLQISIMDSQVHISPQAKVVFGKLITEDVMKVIQGVDPGPKYAQRLCDAVNLDDFEIFPDRKQYYSDIL